MKKSILAIALVVAMVLTCALTAFAVNEADTITGDLTVTGFFAEKTDAVPLKSGDTLTLKFHNKSNGVNNYENFVLAVTGAIGDAYTGAAQEILIVRADSWGWGGDMSDLVAPGQAGNALVFETDVNWDTWVAEVQAGVDVEITLARQGDTLTYNALIGSHYVKTTAVSGKALPETAYVFLTGENCTLTGITVSKTSAEPAPTEPAATEPDATEPDATEPAATEPDATEPEVEVPKIEGTLDVTSFFNEKTNMVPLKSGESYTFKFKNTSKGSNNWENFVLAVTGATGDAYTGADQEILIVRADNWGWGGGMSDFVAPDQTGNTLAFESNIDWDQWVSMMKAGVNVQVTIGRKGDTLTYKATIGDYYVNLTATSGKALPETSYVFFTGENCTLSNIQTVSTPKDSVPKTGDETNLGLWAALMAVSAIGLAVVLVKATPVFSRKK